ncbi:MAG: hypothetical protein J5I90_00775 [Caldilineales bacterium]|nr:hypothetical protein [Caldilineales bacterium]
MHELEHNTDSRLYESAVHVFKRLPGPALRAAVSPVADALDDPMATTYAPVAASLALRNLHSKQAG